MKIRIGYGLGAQRGLTAERFNDLVDTLEALRFDSLWLSERVSGDAPDPIIGLSVAAGRTKKLKLGTSVQVLPGRNPALLAKELASLDVLSGGRLLPGFGLGVVNPAEQQAFGVAREDRSAWFDEALPLVRRLWTEDAVDHDGARFHYEALRVLPKPVQQPPDVWLGGRAPGELRRVGRLGDGWLASFSTPAVCADSRPAIEAAAAEAGRAIDPEHFGAMVFYSHGEVPEPIRALIASRNPEADPDELVPSTVDALERQVEQYVERDFSKLVLVPLQEPDDWRAELEPLAERILALQN
ncbi:MAG TPA: LLM class flavin-dependent oxidoreductase [Acidimicrobiia bacterium]|jgi:probable F420-dependent oxidoreductase